ncbi:MAG: O-antigen ligase family protein [Myxococcales bacterium]|nr:O-antigen ligase family protein [Myxococcales bacterium]
MTAERLCIATIAFATVGSVLAIGSVHLPATVVTGVLATAAATLALRTRVTGFGALQPAGVLLLLAAYSGLQAVPIPFSLLATLAPNNADVWRRALAPLGAAGPGWASISLDAGASVVEALKWLTYAFVFVASAITSMKRGATWGLSIVLVAGVAAALTTLVHGLLGADKVFGLYQPSFPVAAWHVGPLLNPNNLASYLNLTALIGAGLMLSDKPVAPRWLLGLAVATVVGVSVTTASRGGALVLASAVVALAIVIAVTAVRRGKRAVLPRAFAVFVIAVCAGGGALAYLGGTARTWAELYDKDLAKLKILTWAKPMIVDHPWLGIGRGAFESVFPAYRSEAGNVIYSHAESFPVQWAAEWGVPVALLSTAALFWLMRPSRLAASRSTMTAGGWIGLAAVALHNLVDLGMEVPAVMIAMSVTAGSLAGHAHLRSGALRLARKQSPPSSPAARRALAPTAALLGGSAAAAALAFGWHDVGDDRARLYRNFADGAGARDPARRHELRATLRQAILRHPADPYFPLLGALLARAGKDASPLPWLARALERSPHSARPHLLAAEVLSDAGRRSQAFMHLRLAAERDPTAIGQVAARAVGWSRDHSALASVVPDGPAAARTLEALALAIPANSGGELRRQLLRDALALEPKRHAANEALAWDLLRELEQGDSSPACRGEGRARCTSEVSGFARVLEDNSPENSAGLRVRAALLRRDGKAGEAERFLAARCHSMQDRPVCLKARLDAAAECRPPTQLTVAIREFLASHCSRAEDCATAASQVGDMELARGEPGSALAHFRRAAAEAPTEERWLKLADAAASIGAHAQALEALGKVADLRGGADEQLRARIAGERAAALRQTDPTWPGQNQGADGGI